MKKILLLTLLLIVACAVTVCAKENSAQSVFKIGTGGTGGNYYSYGRNFDTMIREKTSYALEVRATSGSAANIRLISQGFLDMGIAQSDTIADAYAGKGVFEKPLTGFHPVTGLYTESCQLIVSASSGIKDVSDLLGKRVSIGEDESGVQKNALQILTAAGIPQEKFSVYRLSFLDAAQAVKNGTLDAFFVTAGTPTKAVADLAHSTPIRLISLSETILHKLNDLNPQYTESVIPAGTYANQDTPIRTIGVKAVLIASDLVPTEVEKEFLSILTENGSKLQKVSFAQPAKPKISEGIYTIHINMYLTLALSVCVLYLGTFMRRRITFLETFCIPAPVVGGLVFAVISCILHAFGIAEFKFDET
ncbi:MAG: TAXI family TRAP transporter solute-binding subunit [Desulfovibrionaceae bacterium]|nr:TAXI family TRAP transporter solute-binding subunit [Desulfovibrionaceae bacterium]